MIVIWKYIQEVSFIVILEDIHEINLKIANRVKGGKIFGNCNLK